MQNAGLQPKHLYNTKHQAIYVGMMKLLEQGPLDVALLVGEVKEERLLILDLVTKVETTVQLASWLGIVLEAARKRHLEAIADEIGTILKEGKDSTEASEYIEEELEVVKETGNVVVGLEFVSMKDDIAPAFRGLCKAKDGLVGLATGLTDLDSMMRGLKEQELTIIAARPAQGKSALGMSIAGWHIKNKTEKKILFFSYEMSNKECQLRLGSYLCDIDTRRLMDKVPAEMERIKGMVGEYDDLPIVIVDKVLATTDLRSISRQAVRQLKIDLIVIDYLQLIPIKEKTNTEQERLSMVSGMVKRIAKENNVPILALCQFNRDSDKENRPPKLGELRGSGSLEQDADNVLGIHHKEERSWLYVLKQRNGPTGRVEVLFEKHFTKFRDLEPEQQTQESWV